jgi:hypothetical protein
MLRVMGQGPAAVVVSGHMVDAPDRARPRFPESEVPRVTAEVREALASWRVGPGTTVISGGARGADIIAAEVARARGARIRLLLALPPEEFEQTSVALPGTDWVARFRAITAATDVEVVEHPPGADVFASTNARMVDEARAIDSTPLALVVWDGREGDGPGGTRDFVSRLGYSMSDEHLRVIDPTPPPGS